MLAIQRRVEALVVVYDQSTNNIIWDWVGNIIVNDDGCTTNLMQATSTGVVLSIHLPTSLEFPGVSISNGAANVAGEAVDNDDGNSADNNNSSHDREGTLTKDVGVAADVN